MEPLMRTYPGIVTFFPDIMIVDWGDGKNVSECICSDIQREDYSPGFEWANYITIILALPVLSVFGVLTNFINVFLYSRKRLQNSANTYLLFLACSDFAVIITGLFIFWIDSARSYIPALARAPYTTVYALPLGYMAQTCSIYFTVAAAVDCFVNVCWQNQTRRYCTVTRAKQICYSIVFISVMYNSLRFPQFNLRQCFNEDTQEQVIEICPTSLFVTINTVYNMYMYMVLMTLLPFFFLLCINVIIMRRQSFPKKSTDSTASGDVCKQPETSGTSDDTITMIMVVILFPLLQHLGSGVLLNFLTDTSNFLVVFNSSVNCVIYYIFNADYREMFHIYAKRLWTLIRDEKCCCVFGSSDPFNVYQPVATRLVVDNKNCNGGCNGIKMVLDRHEMTQTENSTEIEPERNSSPIWQPLTSQHLPNVQWLSPFEPTSHIVLVDDDNDSGCDDVSQISTRAGTRWLAEVNIVDEGASEGSVRRPQIFVKPISSLPIVHSRDSRSEIIPVTSL
ncbi:unnamed protein product [Caenorhabditis auriculariae]|uniref:G-protein coupled receptors family 1 profile domain-containing protein n=1 Tax=Caenorhabditis auriculariae TaxID=2777116 RepID=A0A8S1I0E7_9PELO|nr:unnamed protein product [Caenorhabditis auriculariae]